MSAMIHKSFSFSKLFQLRMLNIDRHSLRPTSTCGQESGKLSALKIDPQRDILILRIIGYLSTLVDALTLIQPGKGKSTLTYTYFT